MKSLLLFACYLTPMMKNKLFLLLLKLAPPIETSAGVKHQFKTKGRHSRENGSGAVKKQTPAPSVETDCVFTASQLLIVIPSFYPTVGTV